MIAKIEGDINIGITALVGKVNEIIDQINVDVTAKDETIAALSAELTATRADAGLVVKPPVVAVPIEEPIEPVIEEPMP